MTGSTQNTAKLRRSDLLGFFTHPGTAKDYLELVSTSVRSGVLSTIYYHNLHTVYVYLSNKTFQQSYQNKTVLVDGMVLLFIYKLAGFRLRREHRVTYVEFIIPLMEMARDNGLSVFHVGQHAEMQEKAFAAIRRQVPGVQIAGHHGYFDLTESSVDTAGVINKINEYSADILLVGLGSPAQELWVDANRHKLNVPAVLTCGSCMDYLAGKVKAAPRWMSRLGLEAIYRVYADPKRLAYRYIVEPILLLKIVIINRIQKHRL